MVFDVYDGRNHRPGSFNGTLLAERLHSRLGFTYISTGNHQKMAVIGQSGVLVVPRHTVAK